MANKKLGRSYFKSLTVEERFQLLEKVEKAVLVNMGKFGKQVPAVDKTMEELNVSNYIIDMATSTKRFRDKVSLQRIR